MVSAGSERTAPFPEGSESAGCAWRLISLMSPSARPKAGRVGDKRAAREAPGVPPAELDPSVGGSGAGAGAGDIFLSLLFCSPRASSLQTRAADRGWDEERIQAPSGSSLRRSLESEGVRSEPPDPVGGISPSLR